MLGSLSALDIVRCSLLSMSDYSFSPFALRLALLSLPPAECSIFSVFSLIVMFGRSCNSLSLHSLGRWELTTRRYSSSAWRSRRGIDDNSEREDVGDKREDVGDEYR